MTAAWQPSASARMLRARAKLLAGIRDYFAQTGVLEVETPVCSFFGTTDPAIASLSTPYQDRSQPTGERLYLHTSPEFAMKRLLASGLGSIYQICKVFRDNESGRLHNPEFSLLEWYRVGYDHHQLMSDVAALVLSLLDQSREVEKLSYAEVFGRYLSLDPHSATPGQLRECALDHQLPITADFQLPDRDAWLDLLMSHSIEPELGKDGLCFIYDYPASQSSLAQIRAGDPPIAERFELYMDGIELANGFHELTDAAEQEQRFHKDLEKRRENGLPAIPMDYNLIAALRQGMPACAGVALGIDRLLMRLTGARHINEVLAFPIDRA